MSACTRTSCHARPTEKIKAAKAWSIWEGRISKLVQDPLENMKHGDEMFALAFARIENHYFTNKGFFPR
jgi:proline iminopeptidase